MPWGEKVIWTFHFSPRYAGIIKCIGLGILYYVEISNYEAELILPNIVEQ